LPVISSWAQCVLKWVSAVRAQLNPKECESKGKLFKSRYFPFGAGQLAPPPAVLLIYCSGAAALEPDLSSRCVEETSSEGYRDYEILKVVLWKHFSSDSDISQEEAAKLE